MKAVNTSKTLDALLKQAGNYYPVYRGGLATHLPMVLIALHRLGAANEKLEQVFQMSTDKLTLIENLEETKVIDNVMAHLGQRAQFTAYLQYFKHQLIKDGRQAVLAHFLPLLMPGLAASAFHALIRLAYGIEASNDNEIAIALAYWCAEFQAVEINESTTSETLSAIMARLAPIGAEHSFKPGIIVDRMDEVASLLRQRKAVCMPEKLQFSDVRQFCLRAFYAENDFTLLHTVTGCHAFSLVMPYLTDNEASVKILWRAILVAYLSSGLYYSDTRTYPSKETKEPTTIDFSPIIAQAILSCEPHVIKLVYTCFCEYQQDQDPLYFQLAKRAILGGYD
ncbi:questin oxidase family protein [uncultured Shewanella sp.]|uniref:questin oxidase family protein n=1 Tax=uncultured Shewanella sp. TaxID=173975 RepID=UPI00260ECEA0|nr:questin oxidase family protein [uncultured Shewanella sp.]